MEKKVHTWASGNWVVISGKEDEFVARWIEFLEWAREETPGLVSASLIRDEADGRHFVSFAQWEGAEARTGWQTHNAFPQRLGACRALCDEFVGGNYRLAAQVP